MTDATEVRILFLCTGNSCRSQMAEGWGRHLKPDQIEAYSAGIEPKGLVPLGVRVMAEAGVYISAHRPKRVREIEGVAFDYVVTICSHAQETCPRFPGSAKIVHHGFDDPPKLAEREAEPEQAAAHYRRVRDEIRAFVATLPGALDPSN